MIRRLSRPSALPQKIDRSALISRGNPDERFEACAAHLGL